MALKFLPFLVAVLAGAFWPQGVIVCVRSDGRVEVELEAEACCPLETDESCIDCTDIVAPDRRVSPQIVSLAPPAVSSLALLPDDGPWSRRGVDSTLLLPPRDSVLEGVKLLV